MPSIQARLATGLLVSLIVLLLAQWIVVERSIEKLSEQYIASRLVHSSDLLVAAISVSENAIVLDNSRIDPVYNKPFSGFYYTIQSGEQKYRSRSLWDESLPLQTVSAGDTLRSRHIGPQGQQLLLVNSAYKKNSRVIQIAVAENISDINKEIDSLLKSHALLSLIILAVLVLVQVVIIRRSLLPLERSRRELIDLESGLIQQLDENVPREIHALVHEINLRIAAFQQRLERSRRASGNLAHALKRPLTLLSQLGQESDSPIDPQVAKQLQQYTGEIKHIIERELSRARMAGTAVGAKQTELCSETRALIALLQAMYSDKQLSIELDAGQECKYSIDREDFHELMGNILDNACKWAKRQIKVIIHCDAKLVIVVEDDGPGIAPELRESMLKRGVRLDEQVDGHGLGMSIVSDVVEQYRGSIDLQQSPSLGGLALSVKL